ncbi:MAG: M28 family peptidase [Bacteroidota bacterium]
MSSNQHILSKLLLSLLTMGLAIVPYSLHAQSDSLYQYQELPGISIKLIEPDRLIMNVRDLSSPAFEGRELGTYGNEKAANWVEFKFRDLGLTPFFGNSFRQSFPISQWELGDSNRLDYADSTFSAPQHWVPAYYSSTDSLSAHYTYLPSNINEVDTAQIDGHIILTPLPVKSIPYRPFFKSTINRLDSLGAKAVIFSTLDAPTTPHSNESYRFEDFIDLPVQAQKTTENTPSPFLGPEQLDIPVLFARPATSSFLIQQLYPEQQPRTVLTNAVDIRSSNQQMNLSVSVDKNLTTEAVNIAGYIEGQRPLEAGYILITSSFDQEGQHPIAGTPFFGSNDNASGIAVMMEIASIFAHPRHPKPTYPIVFAGLNGTQRDFVGARYFAKHGIRDPNKVVSDLNLRALAGGTISDSSNVYIEGISQDHSLSQLAQKTAAELDITLIQNREQTTPLTSVINVLPFNQRDIPSLAISGGPYSLSGRILDSPDKLNYVQLYYATEYVLELSWRLATLRQEVPRLNKPTQ